MVQGLLTNVQSRGLRTDRSLLVILDGAQAPSHGRDPDVRPRGSGATLSGA